MNQCKWFKYDSHIIVIVVVVVAVTAAITDDIGDEYTTIDA